MKKIIMTTWAFIAIVCLVLVSCEKDTSKKHTYTPEELEWIRINDSLKQIIPADFVLSQDVTVPISKGYDGVTVKLVADADTARFLDSLGYDNMSEIVAALGTLDAGVQSGNDITFFAYNYSTKYEYTSPSTTNYFGHWFDANGDVVNWGDQAYLFCEKQDETTTNFTIGLFPNRPTVGNVYKIVEAIEYDGYKIAFLFNVTIGPEEVLQTTVVGTETINLNVPLADYTAAITTFGNDAVATALGLAPEDASLKGINGDNTLSSSSMTASYGYWYNSNGDVCNWGAEGIAYYVEYYSDDQTIGVGLYPGVYTAGQTFTARIAFVNETSLKQYNIVLNITIIEPELVYPVTTIVGQDTLEISQVYNETYAAETVVIDIAAITAAIGIAPADAELYGIQASDDSLYIKGYTGEAPGYWFDINGEVCTWGATGCGTFANFKTDLNGFQVGQFPAGVAAGNTYTMRLAFVNLETLQEYDIVIELTVTAAPGKGVAIKP